MNIEKMTIILKRLIKELFVKFGYFYIEPAVLRAKNHQNSAFLVSYYKIEVL